MTAFASTRPSIKVDGEQRTDLQDALLSMSLHLPMHGMGHGELHLTNWGINEGGQAPDFTFRDIAFGAQIEVFLAGDGGYQQAFDGQVTGIEEVYGGGAPQLRLLIQDKMHLLARARFSRAFEEQSVDAVIATLAEDVGLQADASVSSQTAHYHQLNESNLAFLNRLLGGYDVYARMEGDSMRVHGEEPDAVPITLNPQNSALKIRLTADLNRQPSSSKVLGYNAGTAEEVDGEATRLSDAQGQQARELLEELGWPGDEEVPQPFARSMSEADAYAQAHFHRMAQRFVTGHIQCMGEPALRGGREVELTGVSPRMQGTYRVTHCTHQFTAGSGFETHLRVRRGGWQA